MSVTSQAWGFNFPMKTRSKEQHIFCHWFQRVLCIKCASKCCRCGRSARSCKSSAGAVARSDNGEKSTSSRPGALTRYAASQISLELDGIFLSLFALIPICLPLSFCHYFFRSVCAYLFVSQSRFLFFSPSKSFSFKPAAGIQWWKYLQNLSVCLCRAFKLCGI